MGTCTDPAGGSLAFSEHREQTRVPEAESGAGGFVPAPNEGTRGQGPLQEELVRLNRLDFRLSAADTVGRKGRH